jgi:hypothetical protein
MATTTLLDIELMESTDTVIYALFNTAIQNIEDAENRGTDIDLTGLTTYSLNRVTYTRRKVWKFNGHSAPCTVTVPSTDRVFIVINLSTTDEVIIASSGIDTITVDPEDSAIIANDGGDLFLIASKLGATAQRTMLRTYRIHDYFYLNYALPADRLVYQHVFTTTGVLNSAFWPSYFRVVPNVGWNTPEVYTMYKNGTAGTAIGTFTKGFASGDPDWAWNSLTGTDTTFAPGDVMNIYAPVGTTLGVSSNWGRVEILLKLDTY